MPNIIIDHGDGYFTQYLEFDVLASESDDVLRRINSDILAAYELSGTVLVNEGDVLGQILAEQTTHLHFQVRYDPGGNGRSAGLSTEPNPDDPQNVALRDVTVGGRLFKDFQLFGSCDVDCQTQIWGPKISLLPNTNASGGGEFDFNINAGNFGLGVDELIYIDPVFAIGYDYEVNAGANFRSVLLPILGDNEYELWLLDTSSGEFLFSQFLSGGVEFDFDPGGLPFFRILGIEIGLGLDANDPTAFVTGLTFTGAGNVDFSMMAISAPVPLPSALPLFGTGLAVMGFIGWRRKRITAAAA